MRADSGVEHRHIDIHPFVPTVELGRRVLVRIDPVDPIREGLVKGTNLLIRYDGFDLRIVADVVELVVRDDRSESIDDFIIDLGDDTSVDSEATALAARSGVIG